MRLLRHAIALCLGLFLGAAAHQAFALSAGAVVPFNLAACPTGWTAFSDGVGRVVVGVGTLGSESYTLAGTGGSAFRTLTVAQVPGLSGTTSGGSVSGTTNTTGSSHQHTVGLYNGASANGTLSAHGNSNVSNFAQSTSLSGAHTHTFSASFSGLAFTTTGGGGSHDTRQPYVALLLCSLDADEAGGTGAAQAIIIGGILLLFAIGFATGQKAS